MTVGELKEKLEDLDESKPILFEVIDLYFNTFYSLESIDANNQSIIMQGILKSGRGEAYEFKE